MKYTSKYLLLIFAILSIGGCSIVHAPNDAAVDLASPDNSIQLSVNLNKEGKPFYKIYKKNSLLMDSSAFDINEAQHLQWKLKKVENFSKNQEWKPVLGRKSLVTDHFNAVKLTYTLSNQSEVAVTFKVYNDGAAYQYTIQQWQEKTPFNLTEKATFHFAENMPTLWTQAHNKQYQKTYHHTSINEMDSAHIPVTMKSQNGPLVSILQAGILNYPDMKLRKTGDELLEGYLVPWADGSEVKVDQLPFSSPWRVILIAEDEQQLFDSHLVLNLNEPSRIKNTDWIKPMRYLGIWWEMHIGYLTWYEGDRHAATTERTKALIDFAADNGIEGVLVEGWNTGWDHYGKDGFAEAYSFVQQASDYDLKAVAKYAQDRGVELMMHHETAGMYERYEREMAVAMQQCEDLGIRSIKTGYSGPMTEWRHGQRLSQHHVKVLEEAEKHQIMINIHEPVMPSGTERTYPNYITAEAVRGMEMEAWSEGLPVGHAVDVAYTRMLSGPMDYTPGIFDIKLDKHRPNLTPWHPKDDGRNRRVHSTLSHQLALYVVLFSPWQMLADLPENYEGNPAFEFLKKVPTVWEDVKVLDAKFGEYIVMARKHGDQWFIGGINSQQERTVELSLAELGIEKMNLDIFADAEDTDYDSSPEKCHVSNRSMNQEASLSITMKKGGGFTAIVSPANRSIAKN
ncbi:glycoside hydrolase family 97 protein [Persicobacter psychrovividus]|uniref:Alpha-glucosidase n=1 Tax=Persicobacter psychrovividus TaxID=387638 RepID=A0ABM7VI08_9BACT|nr:alpha-glucosidase [Persicobacter psychrovividus]